MRRPTIVGLLVLTGLVGAAPGLKDPSKKGPHAIVGEWVEDANGRVHFVFTKDGRVLRTEKDFPDVAYTYTADEAKVPAEIDLTQTGANVTSRGIYKVEGDTLTLCFGLDRGAVRPAKFAKAEQPPVGLSTFTRAKPQE